MTRTPQHLLESSRSALETLRSIEPLVHCITNSVVTNFTANALLALGASPAMVDIPVESGPFATIASGLLVNLGTPAQEQREAAIEAARAAGESGTPWVLDPADLKSKCKNTPFDEARLTGRAVRTIVGGRTVFEQV